jgi:hypothetical protein
MITYITPEDYRFVMEHAKETQVYWDLFGLPHFAYVYKDEFYSRHFSDFYFKSDNETMERYMKSFHDNDLLGKLLTLEHRKQILETL